MWISNSICYSFITFRYTCFCNSVSYAVVNSKPRLSGISWLLFSMVGVYFRSRSNKHSTNSFTLILHFIIIRERHQNQTQALAQFNIYEKLSWHNNKDWEETVNNRKAISTDHKTFSKKAIMFKTKLHWDIEYIFRSTTYWLTLFV